MGTSSITFTVSTRISSILCYICTHETFVVSTNWQVGKDQKYQNKCRCPQPSQAPPREKVQRAPIPNQSDRRQHHPLCLVQHPRFEQHLLLQFIQCPRRKKYLLFLNQHPRRKQAQPMYLNRSPTQPILTHHRLCPLRRQSPFLLKVKYRPQNRYR